LIPDRSDKSWLKNKSKPNPIQSLVSLTPTTKLRIPMKSQQKLKIPMKSQQPPTPVKSQIPVTFDQNQDDTIYFYTGEKYPELSNYYDLSKQPFMCWGKQFKSSEHAYQYKKFNYEGASESSFEYAEAIRLIKTPNMSREIASQKIKGGYPWRTALNPIIKKYLELGVVVSPTWDADKDSVMESVLRCKFTQNIHCKKVLLNTGSRRLVEHTSRDHYWADGGDGSGKNMLGILLMKIRNELSQ
jgi:ribA/ribD-fused uncharacterized protein